MNAPRHSFWSHRAASLLVALAIPGFFSIDCVREHGGGAGTPEGSRAAERNDGSRAPQTAAGRSTASASGSRATRVLDERCAPRVAVRDPGPGPKIPNAAAARLIGEPVAKADECVRHTDCAARPHGRCVARAEQANFVRGRHFVVPAHNECLYDDCLSDAECRERGEYEPRTELVCRCDVKERNTCTFANCRTTADCPPPYSCGGFQYCHSAADECQETSDCTGRGGCAYSWEKKHYVCAVPQIPLPG